MNCELVFTYVITILQVQEFSKLNELIPIPKKVWQFIRISVKADPYHSSEGSSQGEGGSPPPPPKPKKLL